MLVAKVQDNKNWRQGQSNTLLVTIKARLHCLTVELSWVGISPVVEPKWIVVFLYDWNVGS